LRPLGVNDRLDNFWLDLGVIFLLLFNQNLVL
jgi:hypothetical protein